jgi:hypothetical protein
MISQLPPIRGLIGGNPGSGWRFWRDVGCGKLGSNPLAKSLAPRNHDIHVILRQIATSRRDNEISLKSGMASVDSTRATK